MRKDIIFRTNEGERIVFEVKTGYTKHLHTPFNYRLTPNISLRAPAMENIDGQAWYPDTFETIDERSELRF